MYDELVKRLREFASIPEHCENVASCDQCSKESICLSFTNKRIIEVATQAADAIEELLAENKEILYRVEIAENMIAFYQEGKPLPNVQHWISVEDALPKKKVGDEGYNGYLVLSDGEYQIADFTHDKYMQTAYEFHVDGEYDPNITHWMELPPKEDAE